MAEIVDQEFEPSDDIELCGKISFETRRPEGDLSLQ